MQFSGPRPACLELDRLVDEIGNPVIEIINRLEVPEEEKAKIRNEIEAVLVNVFVGENSTPFKIRQYIYDLNRELAKKEAP